MAVLSSPNAEVLRLNFMTVDVFTKHRYQGNPLAVVCIPGDLEDQITKQIKQRITREFNLSETVFLHLPSNSTIQTIDTSNKAYRADIFSGNTELTFGGHPIIGTAFLVLEYLCWNIDALQLKSGIFPVRYTHELSFTGSSGNITTTDKMVQTSIAHNLHIHSRTLADLVLGPGASAGSAHAVLAAALSADAIIRQAELDAPVVSIVQGMTAILVKLPSLAHLARVSTASRLYFDEAIQGLLLDQGLWGRSFCYRYYYVEEDQRDDGEHEITDMRDAGWASVRRFRARMVEVATEDPASGSAACTLGAYLAIKESGKTETVKFEITQGIEMGRKSDIVVEVKRKVVGNAVTIEEVTLCGTAVVVATGSIAI